MQKLPYENVNSNIMRTSKEEENKSKAIIELCPDGSLADTVPEAPQLLSSVFKLG